VRRSRLRAAGVAVVLVDTLVMLEKTVEPVQVPAPPHLASTASPLAARASLVLLACVLGVTAAVFGLAVATILLLPGARAHGATLVALSLPLHSLAVLATVHAVLRRAATGWTALGFRRPTARLLHLLWQVPSLIVGALVAQVATFVLVGRQPSPEGEGLDGLVADVGPVTVLAVLVSVVVLVPIWEEAVFRGVIQGGLRRRWPVQVAVPLGAACFAAAHGVPLLLPYMLTVGIGLAVLREVHRTLWASVLAHAALNAVASVSLLSAVLR
jgi:CAAX protease family protein